MNPKPTMPTRSMVLILPITVVRLVLCGHIVSILLRAGADGKYICSKNIRALDGTFHDKFVETMLQLT
jgi:hypothetical protein